MNNLEKYADILIQVAVNLKQNQNLVIYAPFECYDFIKVITQRAYNYGAKYVHINYTDNDLDQIRLRSSKIESLNYYPNFLVNNLIDYEIENCAILKLNPGFDKTDLELLSKRILVTKSQNIALEPYKVIKNKKTFQSCSTIIPTKKWAKQIFPNLDETKGIEKLWQMLFKIANIESGNPVDFWKRHISEIIKRRDILNYLKINKLHFFDEHSNFNLLLPSNHYWIGGCELTCDNIAYMPNFPTEEIFTTIIKDSLNGVVKSSKPLIFQGQKIDNFGFYFKDGKVISSEAMEGHSALNELLNYDDGSSYVGEIALLQGETLISNTNTTFQNTLLDENAACHMALGCAYPVSVLPHVEKTKQNYLDNHINFSNIHVDFMFGSKAINVVADDIDGNKIDLITDGKWCI